MLIRGLVPLAFHKPEFLTEVRSPFSSAILKRRRSPEAYLAARTSAS
jgi:hypothetical protein